MRSHIALLETGAEQNLVGKPQPYVNIQINGDGLRYKS